MLTARLPARSYAAEAGGKFSRKKPHFKYALFSTHRSNMLIV
jgi:hypothetical protein